MTINSISFSVDNGLIEITAELIKDTFYHKKEFQCLICGQQFIVEYQPYSCDEGSIGVKPQIKSEHLIKLDSMCRLNKIEEIYRGADIYDKNKNGEWVYFQCYFDEKKIRERFNFPTTIKYYEYDGRVAGQESGFIDELTNDAVLGHHPLYGHNNNLQKLQ